MAEDLDKLSAADFWAAHLLPTLTPKAGTFTSSWLRPLRAGGDLDGGLLLLAPTEFGRTFVTDHYLDVMRSEARRLLGRELPIRVDLDPDPPATEPAPGRTGNGSAATRAPAAVPIAASPPEAPAPPALQPVIVPPRAPASSPRGGGADGLPPIAGEFTFEAFVVGPSNRLAHAGALAVTERPGSTYNPLFIYGRTGLGKTHLGLAIANRLRATRPDLFVCYRTANDFMLQYCAAVRTSTADVFRRHFREQIDLLIIDDVQFLAGKEGTLDEFFHTFEALTQNLRQIVLTSDRSPREIPDLAGRLQSRFGGALTADIEPPDLETRIAILVRKAEQRGHRLPHEVAAHLGERCGASVRDLEGALISLLNAASAKGEPLSVTLAIEALRHLPVARSLPTIERAAKVVAAAYGVSVADLRSASRCQEYVQPRHVAMYLGREVIKAPFQQIGRYFGRHHASVIDAVRNVKAEMARDSSLRARCESLQLELRD